MKKLPVVRVVWHDAHQLTTIGELTVEQALERAHEPLLTTSCGHLLRDDEIGVTIATDVQDNLDDDGEPQLTVRGVTFVPRGMIVKVEGRSRAKGPKKPRKPKAAPAVAGDAPPDAPSGLQP